VITSEEMHRRTHNRHSPPNAISTTFGRKSPHSRAARDPSQSPGTIRTCFIPPATCKHRIAKISIYCGCRGPGCSR
jgi:hypothetical protein